jgi:glucokinase
MTGLPKIRKMEKQQLVAGVDIGGTNVRFGMVDATGAIHAYRTLKTGDYPDPPALVDELSARIKETLYDMGPGFELVGVGIGAPNGNYYKGTIEFAPNLKWYGIIPFAKMMEEKLRVRTILTNDANAAAIGEMMFGGAKGMKDFLFITLGTGLGSGLVVNGEVLYGHDGFAGEVGHVIVFPDGRLCGCGRKGCAERYCSATGLKRTYIDLLKRENPASDPSEKDIDARYIYSKALENDPIALEAFEYTGEILGLVLANSVAYSSPQAIFLFGGLVNAGDLLFRPTKESFEKNLLNIYRGKIPILPSMLKEDEAAISGAASLVWKELEHKTVSYI